MSHIRRASASRPLELAHEPRIPDLREHAAGDSWTADALRRLATQVGGLDVLFSLDAEPHVEVPPGWQSTAVCDGDVLVAVLECLANPVTTQPFGTWAWECIAREAEYRVIAERLLARIAARDAKVLSTQPPARVAAALTWLAFAGNGALGRRGAMRADTIWAAFGVPDSRSLGLRLRRATGVPIVEDPYFTSGPRRSREPIWLADPELLHSRKRAMVLQHRDVLVGEAETRRRQELESRPVRLVKEGFQVRAHPVTPRGAIRVPTAEGRLVVVMLFGEDENPLDASEALALSVPDAHRLVASLQHALQAPVRRPA